MLKWSVVGAAMAVVGMVGAAVQNQIVSPDGRLSVVFTLKDGEPRAALNFNGKPIANVELGLDLELPHTGGFLLENSKRDSLESSWKTVWGERAEIPERYCSLMVNLRERGPAGRRLAVEMRAYPEGFAVRYKLPEGGKWKIVSEKTRFVFPPDAKAWGIYGTEDTYPAAPLKIADLKKNFMLPLTVEIPDIGCASLMEAYVRHYPRAKGDQVEGGVKIRLLGDAHGGKPGTAAGEGAFETPWRALQIGAHAAELVENATLARNLNPPCAIEDTSWIKPGLCLSDLSNCAMNNKDVLAAATRERENNIRHFQIDWGWYGTEWTWTDAERAKYAKSVPGADAKHPEWRANTTANPRRPAKGYVPYRPDCFLNYGTTVDLDVPALTMALGKIGVDLALYMHGLVLEKEPDWDGLFKLYREWGLAGLKPGFVRYGDAASTDWNRRLVETAAKHHLWLDIHDAHVPDGMERTYPNLLLCEGGGGEEGNHPVRQDVIQPFARCLVGPFDYTPMLFRSDRTHAHSAAHLLVYPGPAAILRGSALKRGWGPELDFVKQLPMTYDETKVVAAEIGRFIVVTRRKGKVWYIGGMCGDEGFDSELTLDFLARGAEYVLVGAKDGEGGRAVAFEDDVVSGCHFPLRMAKAGGFVGVIRPSGK